MLDKIKEYSTDLNTSMRIIRNFNRQALEYYYNIISLHVYYFCLMSKNMHDQQCSESVSQLRKGTAVRV